MYMRTRPQLSAMYVSPLFACTRDSPLIVACIHIYMYTHAHARAAYMYKIYMRSCAVPHAPRKGWKSREKRSFRAEKEERRLVRIGKEGERDGEKGNGVEEGGNRCLRARSTFLCWSRRRNIYYPVHGPEGEGWNRVEGGEGGGRGGAGKSSRAANCPPSYPPYTLSHTLTVTTLIPLPPWSPPPAGSSLILHTGSPPIHPPSSTSSPAPLSIFLLASSPRPPLPPRKL